MEASLAELAPRLQLARPTGPLVPVLPGLRELLPDAGLRPGVVVSVTGSTALMLALTAAATTAGTWCAAAGFSGLGYLAAAELGVDLTRLVSVEEPGDRWEEVAVALADGVGVLLLRPTGPVRPAVAERLTNITRKAGCALLITGTWPGARVRLTVASRRWEGLGQGRGRLRARHLVVQTEGRGSAARPRRAGLWFPDAEGSIRADQPDTHTPRAASPLVVV
ncbi:hypothetical protein ACIRBX_24935 [Kitasatospora sp. NPDC096147]|uniref:hypothetical protein n=1 Tax=Kitasatospora sp. NPDC096147 TaxID=3364093 RepID=UPI0038197118